MSDPQHWTCPRCQHAVEISLPKCDRCGFGKGQVLPKKSSSASGVLFLSALCVLAAIGFGFFGLAMLTDATLGVGLVAGACLSGIFARIFQAEAHHRREFSAQQASGSISSRDAH